MKNNSLLLKIREELGLTREEMAIKLGYNKKYIYQIESGNTEISGTILKLLTTFNEISFELHNEIKKKLKEKTVKSKKQKKIESKSNKYSYLIQLINDKEKEIRDLKDEINSLKLLGTSKKRNEEFETHLKKESFIKESTNISLIIDRMWKLRDENTKYFSELEFLLSINNHLENLKLKKGLKTVAISLQEQSNKILSYLEEKVIEIEAD